MTEPQTDLPRGQLFEEAAAWFARMRGPDAEKSRADFESWLARGALHRSAYNRAAEIFAMGKHLKDDKAPNTKRGDRLLRKPTLLAGTLAAVCLILASGWIELRHLKPPREVSPIVDLQHSQVAQPEELATLQEGAAYRLNDGSVVTLSAASRLLVDVTPQLRRLVLEAGEARFTVAHESRPFIVYAGGGSVTATGTVFDVALSRNRQVRVHLIEGVIEVASPGPTLSPRRKRLVAGQSTSFAIDNALAAAAEQPGSQATKSQPAAGVQDYDAVKISALVDAANRISKRQIMISGALGERRVSGRFRIDDTEVLAERIAALFHLSVDRSNPSVILLKPQ